MKKLLVILGPTATGKTDLALQLAEKYNGELVSCDSRQVYKGLDIGTGKLPGKFQISNFKFQIERNKSYWIIDGIRIWMYDLVSPKIQYTVADFVKDADRVIREIWERGKLPIIVGGTGFYLKALLEGLPNLEISVDKSLRKKLEELSLEKLQEKLRKISTGKWKSLNESDRQNPRRLTRAIELSLSSLRDPANGGAKQSYYKKKIATSVAEFTPYSVTGLLPRNDVLRVGLTAPRDILYKRVDERVVTRINQGMIDEAKYLYSSGLSLNRMRQLGLEYGILADYLEGKIGGIEGNKGLIKVMQNKIHGYVRRQLTWFKKEKEVGWFDITIHDYQKKIEILVNSWYYQHNDKAN